MGYLTLADGLEPFLKGIISMWFRAPSVTGFIPLLVFGAKQTWQPYDSVTTNANSPQNYDGTGGLIDPSTVDIPVQLSFTGGSPGFTNPCYVAMRNGRLEFNFQCDNEAVPANLNLQPGASVSSWQRGNPPGGDPIDGTTPDPTGVPGSGWFQPRSFIDAQITSLMDYPAPQSSAEAFHVDTIINLAPGTWHHLLLSFDFTNGAAAESSPVSADQTRYNPWGLGVTRFSKIWYAIDKINRNGVNHLQPYFVEGQGDPNAVVTSTVKSVAGASNQIYNSFGPQATVDYVPNPLPTFGVPLSIPSIELTTDFDTFSTVVCEMAEFQMWTGKSVDTSIPAVRNLFVDSLGKPVPFATAAAVLGRPAIALHGQTDWKAGTSTGSAGNFSTTGTIRDYEFGPGL